MIKLVVALGNPGNDYELTRHNIGWLALDNFFSNKSVVWKKKFKGEYTEWNKIYFLKPMTYMNLSGESVQALCQFFKVDVSDIIALHDEIDLPFGSLVFKKGGGTAGHNGLKSMQQHLGSAEFMRLRFGIGRPIHGSVSSWVLSQFSLSEDSDLEKIFSTSTAALEVLLKQGFEKAASQYSGKKII